ncbi:MAG: hypothetical protein WBV80_25120, partial [Mycobacterium sp.]
MLIDMTSTGFGRSNSSIRVFADHRSQTYRRNQVQTSEELSSAGAWVGHHGDTPAGVRCAANTHDFPRELCDV